jgi:hypothetical protein
MKLKLWACLVVTLGTLAIATQAIALPVPFLSVDVNGYNAGGGQTIGETQAGYQGWEAAEGLFLDPAIDWSASGAAGLTQVFSTSEGNITANLVGVGPSRGARNRGDNSDAQGDMTQDFVFAQRDQAIAFGRHYIKLTLSGLAAGSTYQFTGYARDHFNGGTDSFQAWSDLTRLDGLDGPAAWLDANVGAGASYQPAVGGTDNPMKTGSRSAVSGPAASDPLAFAGSFATTADPNGIVTVYGWADPNSFSGVQGASLLNGFQLGHVPEPASLVLFAFGLAGVALRRVR